MTYVLHSAALGSMDDVSVSLHMALFQQIEREAAVYEILLPLP